MKHLTAIASLAIAAVARHQTMDSEGISLNVGDQIKFESLDEVYTVQACNERYAVCLSELDGKKYYSIIDVERNIRGAHNSYGVGVRSKEECEFVLSALSDTKHDLAISHRNQVPLDIETINGKPNGCDLWK